MEKISSFKNWYEEYVDYYRFTQRINVSDIPKVIAVLTENGVAIHRLRVSNSQEGPDHFFSVFSGLAEFNACCWEDSYIDDFGVTGTYEDKKFDLTFDYIKNQVFTITKENVSIEPLLAQIEAMCQISK